MERGRAMIAEGKANAEWLKIPAVRIMVKRKAHRLFISKRFENSNHAEPIRPIAASSIG